MSTSDNDRGFSDALEMLLGNHSTVWGSTKDQIHAANAQERWAFLIMVLGISLGVSIGYFNVGLGAILGASGLFIGAVLKLDAGLTRLTLNQCAIIELQKEMIREKRRR